MFDFSIEDCFGQTGSGTLPLEKIASKALVLSSKRADIEIVARTFLHGDPPVFGYINNDKYYLDFRTVEKSESEELAGVINRVAEKIGEMSTDE